MNGSRPGAGAGSRQLRLPALVWAPVAILLAAAAVAFGLLWLGERSDDGAEALTCPPGRPDCGLRQRVHWHADFALFIRGQKFDFGSEEFISHEGDEKSEAAHIHEGAEPSRTDVVHVHLEQTTWDEFLRSLGFDLTDATYGGRIDRTCLVMPLGEKLCNSETESFKFFVNGVKVDGIANIDIADLQRVMISYGPESVEEAGRQFETVSDQACILSEWCSERINPDEPPEPCSKSATACY